MAWISITKDQIRLTAAEMEAVNEASLPEDKTADDVIDEAIEDAVKEVRGRVAACKSNTLGAGLTIPDELKGACLALVTFNIFQRVPALRALYDETRQEATAAAHRLLAAVAACDFALVQPDNPTTEKVASPSFQQISGNRRQMTRNQLRGL